MTREEAIEYLVGMDIESLADGLNEAVTIAIEALSAEAAPVVAYICDRRRCAICRGPDGVCDHTTDIKHAAHFKNVAGQYFERPYMEEDDG